MAGYLRSGSGECVVDQWIASSAVPEIAAAQVDGVAAPYQALSATQGDGSCMVSEKHYMKAQTQNKVATILVKGPANLADQVRAEYDRIMDLAYRQANAQFDTYKNNILQQISNTREPTDSVYHECTGNAVSPDAQGVFGGSKKNNSDQKGGKKKGGKKKGSKKKGSKKKGSKKKGSKKKGRK
jgi:hypothetical protein